MRNEETDLSFAEFDDPKRPYTAPRKESEFAEEANYLKKMVTRARFERATPSFGGWCSIQLSYRASRRKLEEWRGVRQLALEKAIIPEARAVRSTTLRLQRK